MKSGMLILGETNQICVETELGEGPKRMKLCEKDFHMSPSGIETNNTATSMRNLRSVPLGSLSKTINFRTDTKMTICALGKECQDLSPEKGGDRRDECRETLLGEQDQRFTLSENVGPEKEKDHNKQNKVQRFWKEIILGFCFKFTVRIPHMMLFPIRYYYFLIGCFLNSHSLPSFLVTDLNWLGVNVPSPRDQMWRV